MTTHFGTKGFKMASPREDFEGEFDRYEDEDEYDDDVEDSEEPAVANDFGFDEFSDNSDSGTEKPEGTSEVEGLEELDGFEDDDDGFDDEEEDLF